jgi:precorrin-2/cobalt-factor-2 C20-methyltransferase
LAKKFYGVGVGVGDSGLLTLKAVETLKNVDCICTPVSTNSDSSRALKIIGDLIENKSKILKLDFNMSNKKSELEKSRYQAAKKINNLLNSGKSVAFITIGDPLLYSTYSYMLEKIKKWNTEIEVETVPGINSIAASAAKYNLALAEGRENTAVLSEVKNEEQLTKIFSLFETVVILKLSRNYQTVYPVLDKLNLKENVVIASKCGFDDEFYTEDIEIFKDEKIDYLTLMIVKRKGI